MIAIRLLLRVLLVPLGVALALLVGVVVMAIAQWNAFAAYLNANPDAEAAVLALIFLAPFVFLVVLGAALTMLSIGAIGILFAEFFAFRSWIYHTANGALAALLGWSIIDPPSAEQRLFSDPTIMIGMGLAAGLTYWLVAGWSAGFWKPVFGRPAPMPPAPLPAPPATDRRSGR